jgi:ankyrin repeat protein
MLLDAGARVDLTPSKHWSLLHSAVKTGNLALTQTLIEHDAELHTLEGGAVSPSRKVTPLGIAASLEERSSSMPLVEYLTSILCRKSTGPIADLLANDVVAAAGAGNDDAIRHFYHISNNLRAPNCDGVTPLHAAALCGHKSTCELLLDLGAGGGTPLGNPSPLHFASIRGHDDIHGRIDMIELLLQHGVRTTGPDRRQYVRSVFFATRMSHYTAAKYLRQSCGWTEEDELMLVGLAKKENPLLGPFDLDLYY